MNQNLKTIAKVSSISVLKWLLIFGTGILLSVIGFLVGLFNNAEHAGGGHGSPIALLIGTLANDIYGFLLMVGCLLFVWLYFALANKVSIQTIIYQVLKNKAGDHIHIKVQSLISGVLAKHTTLNEISNATLLRAKLLQAIQNDPNASKIQRKIIRFGFKKMSLENIDFQKENIDLATILADKFDTFIKSISQPSLTLFWILVIIQIGLIIGSCIYS